MSRDLNSWMNEKLTDVAGELAKAIDASPDGDTAQLFSAGRRHAVHEIMKEFLATLFPGCHGPGGDPACGDSVALENRLRKSALDLLPLTQQAYEHMCTTKCTGDCDCTDMAFKAVTHLLSSLPEIRNTLATDIQATYDGDPAATSVAEVVMSYPGLEAISVHRIAHVLYQEKVPVIPRIMGEWSHSRTGIDIHPGARIGKYFSIDHGTGVVIGETCSIGERVKLYQGVTLGALSLPLDEEGNPVKGVKRHPDIEDNVTIYAGATILGGETVVGNGSVIGGNVWLTHSVPPCSLVNNAQPAPSVVEACKRKQ